MRLGAQEIYDKLEERGVTDNTSFSLEDIQGIVELAQKLPEGVEILEVGCYFGRSALTWALATGGHVTTIDKLPLQHHVNRFAKELGIEKQITTIHSDIKDVYWDKMVDVVWIDADHSRAGVMYDMQKLDKFARLLVCGHDYTQPDLPEVKPAVDEFYEGHTVGVNKWVWSVWKDPKAKPVIFEPELSMVSLFIGRDYSIDKYFQSIQELDYPKKKIHLIWHDTSHDEAFEKKLENWIIYHEREYASTQLIKCGDPHYHFEEFMWQAYDKITDAYNHTRHYLKGDYMFCHEDDILAPPNSLRKLLQILYNDPNVKAASSKNMFRPSTKVGNRPIAWNFKGAEVFPGESIREYTKESLAFSSDRNSGVEYIGSAHLGCTLLDGEWVRQNAFYTANKSSAMGCDAMIGMSMQEQGFRYAIDWGLKTTHVDVGGVCV